MSRRRICAISRRDECAGSPHQEKTQSAPWHLCLMLMNDQAAAAAQAFFLLRRANSARAAKPVSIAVQVGGSGVTGPAGTKVPDMVEELPLTSNSVIGGIGSA